MTITSQQFDKLVTKSDLKKDLKKLEEKIDKKFAAKDDFKKGLKELRQETKSDLDKFAARAFDMFASKDDIKELEKRVASKEDINRLFILMDSIVVKHQEIGTERTANIGAHDRIEADIAKTNKRITVVEKKLEAIPVAA